MTPEDNDLMSKEFGQAPENKKRTELIEKEKAEDLEKVKANSPSPDLTKDTSPEEKTS
jgi:hypothetical protein